MGTVRLFKAQDFPDFPPTKADEAQAADSLLGNRGSQIVGANIQKSHATPEARPRPVLVMRVFAKLAEARRRAVAEAESTRREFRWLAEHQREYADRWVALDGDTLLAVGNSARDVYSRIPERRGRVPLVTKVERADDVYFAGW